MIEFVMIIIFFKEQKGELKNTKKRSEFLWLISVERTERFLSMENKLFLSGFKVKVIYYFALLYPIQSYYIHNR